jgi:hypothetical protein
MKKELDEKLVAKYPAIFKNRNADMKETCMCWGFECGDGWYWIIDHLCGMIEAHKRGIELRNFYAKQHNDATAALLAGDTTLFDKAYEFTKDEEYKQRRKTEMLAEGPRKVEPSLDVVAAQVKEKFGGLRFYVDGADDVVHNYITFAEELSYEICERCGSTADIGQTTTGWISTLCRTCAGDKDWKAYGD